MNLKAVPTNTPDLPYPGDTRVKGWQFMLNHERINQSDTWALAPNDMRPWLLMLWHIAWQQTPAGSFSDNDQVIAAKIGMDYRMFIAHRDILMRGWVKHSDGRLYHPVITEQVVGYLDNCRREAQRKADWRAKKAAEEAARNGNVPRDRRGTDAGVTTPEPEPEPEPRERSPLARGKLGTEVGSSTIARAKHLSAYDGGPW